MNYTHGQIVAFSLRALYRFAKSFQDKEKAGEHLEVMQRHIDFIQECVELLPEAKAAKL